MRCVRSNASDLAGELNEILETDPAEPADRRCRDRRLVCLQERERRCQNGCDGRICPGGQAGRAAPLVVVAPAGEETINNRLTAIGSARALSTVSVTPYSSGYMTKLYVKAGDNVKEGDPVAEMDAETEKIAVAKAEAALKDAQTTRQRIAKLRATNTATQVQVVEAELAVANAQLAQQDAQLALGRRTVRAPISGIVGILPVNVGNYVTAQTSIGRIDDRSKVLIDIWVPERFAPQIKVGQPLIAESTAFPERLIADRSTPWTTCWMRRAAPLHIRAEVPNEQDRLRAGMSFSVTVLFPGDSYPSVDPLAIQWGADGSYVWRIENGIAKRLPRASSSAIPPTFSSMGR